ncbi:Mandelamide hydrolase [compost metagenome]
MIKNTDPGSNAGLPGISLPIGLAGAANLPVGIELDSLPGTDTELLALALMVEKIVNAQTPPTK